MLVLDETLTLTDHWQMIRTRDVKIESSELLLLDTGQLELRQHCRHSS